jgi:hypothetical protein
LEDASTAWQRCTLAWYGGKTRELDLLTGTAVWFHNGLPPVAIRWVLLRDSEGKFDPQALVSNEPALMAVQVIGYFLRRWQVEVTFAEVRAHLGVETQCQWSDPAIERTTPLLFGLFSLVVLYAAAAQGRVRCPCGARPGTTNPSPLSPISSPSYVDSSGFYRSNEHPVLRMKSL